MSLRLSPMVAPFTVDAIKGLRTMESLGKKIEKFGVKAGQSMSTAGRKLTTGLTLPLLGAGAAAVKYATEANRGMANVATLIPGQTDRVYELKEAVSKLAQTSGTDFDTLSAGLYQTISAMGDGAHTMTALTLANKAAKAGIAETSDAINLLSGVSSAYGDNSDKMLNKISDLAFTTVKLGVTTFPELAESMGKSTTIAKTLGVGVEQLFGNFAALTSGTDNTAEVSTRMAAVMGELLRGGGKLDGAFKKLGVRSGKELVAKFGGLNEALFALKDSVNGDEVAFTKLFGRKEALIAALSLTGAKAGEAAREIDAMKGAVGATDQAYREQTDGINKSEFKFKKFIETMKYLARTVGDKLIPILSRFGDKLLPIVDRFAKVDDKTLTLALKVAGLAAAFGPVLMVVGKVTTGVSMLAGALGSGAGGLATVLTVLTGPIGAVVAGLAAATAGVIYFWDELKPVRDAIQAEIRPMFQGLGGDVRGVRSSFSQMGQGLKDAVRAMAPGWAFFAKLFVKIQTLPLRGFIWQLRQIGEVGKNVFSIFGSMGRIIGRLGRDIAATRVAFIRWFTGLSSKYEFLGKVVSVIGKIAWGYKKIWEVIAGIAEAPAAITGLLSSALGAAADKLDPRGKNLAPGRDLPGTKGGKIEMDLRVDAGGAKVGVNTRGASVNARQHNGAVMPAGAPI